MSDKATRDSFGEAIKKLGAENPKIVVLDADLSVSTKSAAFAKAYPERFFQMGIAEANMIGTAAGMAFTGLVPFACSFGEFIRCSACGAIRWCAVPGSRASCSS